MSISADSIYLMSMQVILCNQCNKHLTPIAKAREPSVTIVDIHNPERWAYACESCDVVLCVECAMKKTNSAAQEEILQWGPPLTIFIGLNRGIMIALCPNCSRRLEVVET